MIRLLLQCKKQEEKAMIIVLKKGAEKTKVEALKQELVQMELQLSSF